MLGTATLSVDGASVGTAGFGEASHFATVPSGKVRLAVTQSDKPILEASKELRPGSRYTVVALAGSPPELRAYRDDSAAANVARLRVIHAAPELGKPDLTLDDKVVARQVPFAAATPYWGLPPGNHTLAVTNPSSGKPVIAPKRVPLAAGTASTVLVVGSGGERLRPVLVTDSQAAPTGAPETGLGGLAPKPGGPDWALAALAAVAMGLLLLGAQLIVARRRRAPRA